MEQTIFPMWANKLRPAIPVVAIVIPTYLIALMVYGGHPETTHKNYQPAQPVDYSHALHAGQLGMDCRYCHNTVEKAAHAAVPPTATCMGCHTNIYPNSPKLEKVRDSWASRLDGEDGTKSIDWVRVHNLPDYVYFNHSVHVARGVGCSNCHGRVDQMEKVYQHSTLSMGWCIDCHRQPEKSVRPVSEVTNMAWEAEHTEAERLAIGTQLVQENNIAPPVNCSTCHR